MSFIDEELNIIKGKIENEVTGLELLSTSNHSVQVKIRYAAYGSEYRFRFKRSFHRYDILILYEFDDEESKYMLTFRKTDHKQLRLLIMFPDTYPQTPLIVEVKSKFIPVRVMSVIEKTCEAEAKKLQGQFQVLGHFFIFKIAKLTL